MNNLWVAKLLMAIAAVSTVAEGVDEALMAKSWHETRTANFHLFTCGPYAATAQLAARLEQFRNGWIWQWPAHDGGRFDLVAVATGKKLFRLTLPRPDDN